MYEAIINRDVKFIRSYTSGPIYIDSKNKGKMDGLNKLG